MKKNVSGRKRDNVPSLSTYHETVWQNLMIILYSILLLLMSMFVLFNVYVCTI